jgi:hypothetical protein
MLCYDCQPSLSADGLNEPPHTGRFVASATNRATNFPNSKMNSTTGGRISTISSDNRGPLLNISSWICMVTMSIVVATKLTSKFFKVQRLQSDDYFIASSMVCHDVSYNSFCIRLNLFCRSSLSSLLFCRTYRLRQDLGATWIVSPTPSIFVSRRLFVPMQANCVSTDQPLLDTLCSADSLYRSFVPHSFRSLEIHASPSCPQFKSSHRSLCNSLCSHLFCYHGNGLDFSVHTTTYVGSVLR